MNHSNELNIRNTNTSNVSKVRANNMPTFILSTLKKLSKIEVAYKGCCFFSIGRHSSVSCFSIRFR
ncbi:unnamed protein product [Musa acuminata var. zebrina]